MPNPTDRQAFADALERHDTAAAYAVYFALAAENARLREALDTMEREVRIVRRGPAGWSLGRKAGTPVAARGTTLLEAIERLSLTPEPDHAA